MKREWPHDRGMALPASFVRSSADDQLNLARAFSMTGSQRGRTRKIFVIKKTSRLPSTNAAGKKIRRILIFDNHPDSLRLVSKQRLSVDVDLATERGRVAVTNSLATARPIKPSHLILGLSAILALLVGMLWPLL
jgi:hypothetical protein